MSKFIAWIDERLPVSNFVRNHLSEYYAPKNFNFFYFFGSLALFVFIMQIITGIFLTINYKSYLLNTNTRNIHLLHLYNSDQKEYLHFQLSEGCFYIYSVVNTLDY